MAWKKGKRLRNGPYIIEKTLGQGGFGVVYKAKHINLATYRVIKTPRDSLKESDDYEKYIARFISEARALDRLTKTSHPHIVKVRELFQEEDIPCLVMDFVQGITLFQIVDQKKYLTESEAVRCIRQIADALAFSHEAGVIHRDVHPGNILLQEDGNAILIDFGIAKDLEEPGQTMVRGAGNRDFAPYEQLRGEESHKTVDIYSLAATLYYLVTGEYPTSSYERKYHEVHLIPPKKFNSKISNHLNRVILEGMSLEAKDRPQSMEAFLRLLKKPEMTMQERLQALWESCAVLLGSLTQLNSQIEPNDQTARWSVNSTSNIQRNETHQSFQLFNSTSRYRRNRTVPWLWLSLPFFGYAAMGIMFSQLPVSEYLTAGPRRTMIAWISSLGWALSGSFANIRTELYWTSFSQTWMRTASQFLSSVIVHLRLLLILFAWAGVVSLTLITSVALFHGISLGSLLFSAAVLGLSYFDLSGKILGGGLYFGIHVGERLLISFNRFETFWILGSTSALALGFGWTIGWLFLNPSNL